MSINFLTIKCPDCGAQLQYEEGRKTLFCNYCGAKILLTNDNEYIYRHVDDAEIKRAETEAMWAETERLMKLKEIEAAEKERRAKEKSKKISMCLSLILVVLGIVLMIIGFTFYVRPNLSGLAIIGLLLLIGSFVVWNKSR